MIDRLNKATCRAPGCGKPLTWGMTSKGKQMPLDPDVNPSGNVAVTEPQGDRPRTVRVLKAGERPTAGEWLTTSHHATCEHWQRRR